MNILKNVWIHHIFPYLDDESLFSFLEIKLFDVPSIFWKYRMKTHWIANNNGVEVNSLDVYKEIHDRWVNFVKDIPEESHIQLIYVKSKSPCKTPYHISISHFTNTNYSSKHIRCAPSFIKKSWANICDYLEFENMIDMLNWRNRTTIFKEPFYKAYPSLECLNNAHRH